MRVFGSRVAEWELIWELFRSGTRKRMAQDTGDCRESLSSNSPEVKPRAQLGLLLGPSGRKLCVTS